MKLTIITLALICSATLSFGQDLHFSQPDYAPLTTNPSLAGVDAPLRVGLNYRNQWPLVGASFNTIQANADMRFGDHDPLQKGFVAIGINLYNDLANGLGLMNNKANFHLSYHLKLTDKNRIGVGLYTGLGQRYLGAPTGKWASQYDVNGYNPEYNSGETFEQISRTFADAGFGFDYHLEQGETSMSKNDHLEINAGFAMFHVNRPDVSLNSLGEENLPIRFSYFVNADIGIKNKRNSIMPSIYFNHQRGAADILFGAYYSYMIEEGSKITGFKSPTIVAGGIFHRWNDAIVIKGLMEIKKFAFGVSYDINMSRLSSSSKTIGGFEMFVQYRTRWSKKYDDDSTL